MISHEVVDVLNELLDREQRALAPRLFESTVFVSRLSLDGIAWARRATEANHAHCAMLTELIVNLGGEPPPRRGDVTSADLHYQDLQSILPRLERDVDGLIRAYRAAAAHLHGEPRAISAVTRILAEHETELSTLRAVGAVASTPDPVGQK